MVIIFFSNILNIKHIWWEIYVFDLDQLFLELVDSIDSQWERKLKPLIEANDYFWLNVPIQ